MISEPEQDTCGTSGPWLAGAHKSEVRLSLGNGYEDGQLVPVTMPKETLAELEDNPREGEAFLRALRALVGPDWPANDAAAIGTRTEELLRQLDPGHVVPPHRKRSKQTASNAGKTVFANLGIDRLNTGRSAPKAHREKNADAVKDWWAERKKKGSAEADPCELVPNLPESGDVNSAPVNSGAAQ